MRPEAMYIRKFVQIGNPLQMCATTFNVFLRGNVMFIKGNIIAIY